MQSGYKSGICGHSASVFGNSVSMPIAALGLLGYCNGYRATVAVICNNLQNSWVDALIERDEAFFTSSVGLRGSHVNSRYCDQSLD